ncbi:Uncharacterised protein [Neisseria zoodegmatis]|uniref:Uncharacterized protein n=1 Tax=Neisseria zoodegmatis TaxID=326523 RepID=A0A378WIF2_9NEIS|nr:Uncharacterised protein [Neisseria zoodegmatis]
MPVILRLDPGIPHLCKLKDTRVKPEYDDTFAEEAVGRILESDKIAGIPLCVGYKYPTYG